MGTSLPSDYRRARRFLAGVKDPSGLNLEFTVDGGRVFCPLTPGTDVLGRAKIVPAGYVSSVIDDTAHATAAGILRRVGVTREMRLRFLKPLYTGVAFRADGTTSGTPGEVAQINVRLRNPKEQICIEAEIEIFLLTTEQVRLMSPDGVLPEGLAPFLR